MRLGVMFVRLCSMCVILDPFLTAKGGGEGFCEGIMGQLYISFTECLDSFGFVKMLL